MGSAVLGISGGFGTPARRRKCDLAVLNGGHGVTAQMLLAGKPVLAVPLNLEQQMTGDALRRIGAGSRRRPAAGGRGRGSGGRR